jgi:hypothetical protein
MDAGNMTIVESHKIRERKTVNLMENNELQGLLESTPLIESSFLKLYAQLDAEIFKIGAKL